MERDLQATDTVIIKGVRDGLLFILDDDVPFPRILTELVTRINAQPHFFKGAAITLNSGRRILDRPDFDVLYKMLTRNGMKIGSFVSLSAQARMVAESYGVPSRPPSFAAGDAGLSLGLRERGTYPPPPAGSTTSEGMAQELASGLFLRTGLRPGQTLRHAGDVCILGDVETGADVVADGDIVVWGALRGVAHAGVGGNSAAVVCALHLSPAEVGIAGVTARFTGPLPDDEQEFAPAMARVVSGRIVVERWSET
jgi:septum site-determining protein MinC